MILFLDTSSLVKLYVQEDFSEDVRQLVARAELVAVSVLAYAEARSAFARHSREGGLSPEEYKTVKADFEQDWPHFLALEVSSAVWRRAGELCERYALRGFDGLHLASFLVLGAEFPLDQVLFSCFDQRLDQAARSALESGRAAGPG